MGTRNGGNERCARVDQMPCDHIGISGHVDQYGPPVQAYRQYGREPVSRREPAASYTCADGFNATSGGV